MSFAGMLEAIFITDAEGGPMRRVENAELLPNRGIRGDRYTAAQGKSSKSPDVAPDKQVTLIEAEAVEAVNRDEAISLNPLETRRNLLTRGVPLNHLVGAEFRVGAVRLRGIKLCEPCGYLEKLTGKDGLRLALLHRGGLRAQIVDGGEILPGDEITPIKSG